MSGEDEPPDSPNDDRRGSASAEGDPPAGDAESGRGPPDAAPPGDPAGRDPGPDEVFCYSCGEVIKEQAEICPACGVRQRAPPGGDPAPPRDPPGAPGGQRGARPADPGLTAGRQRELERQANNDRLSTFVLSLFVPPLAYLEVGKPGYAIVNFLTANYMLLGLAIVPLHTYSSINEAREQLRDEGVWGY